MRAPARPRPQTLHAFLRVQFAYCRCINVIFIFYVYFSVDTVDKWDNRHSTKILSVNRGVNRGVNRCQLRKVF